MRKKQKKEILDSLNNLQKAHDEIKEALEQKNHILAQDILIKSQTTTVSIGEMIEKSEGEGHSSVGCLEEYCELLFKVYEDINSGTINSNKAYKTLRKQLIKIENGIKNDITVRKEIVFFPYKASMWDSLESIYLAAKADPECDAYCVPIPYYNLNPDHSLGQVHYEGQDYPKYIEIVDWRQYDFESIRPDIIYTHSPYDDWNLVTSIHPRFYSANLKQYTNCLVYVPYYSTTGGMNEGQRTLPVYFNADYIVTQASMFRDYFDERIPDKKFLPFGSPKFDRIINQCKSPSEPPIEWKKKMQRQDKNGLIHKKVYFYNTSIGGMLGDTKAFLKKLRYVFDTFKGREDVCILWRPHPLMESTFDTMRPNDKEEFEQIKRYFIENDIGIFDDTPDMTDAISWSDAYIGDSGTSVTSLFGIVGKPMFILNNQIHSLPKENSWRGAMVPGTMFNCLEQDRFCITQGNKLYISEPYQYDYKYFCDLSEYTSGSYYLGVFEIDNKRYVCPRNAQDILVLNDKGIERKIELEKRNGNNNSAFFGVWPYEKYLILLPNKYPALVIYDIETNKVQYLEDNISVFVKKNERNERVVGGSWIIDGVLYIVSPTDNTMYALDIQNRKSKVIKLHTQNQGGYISMIEKNGSIWMLPYKGQTILEWNPKTGDIREYTGFPEGFECVHPIYKTPTDEYPLGSWALVEDTIYFTRNWGNMDIKLDRKTGVFSRWDVPVPNKESMAATSKEYFYTTGKYSFIRSIQDEDAYKLFYHPERKLYDFDIQANMLNEIELKFDTDELKQHEDGFNDWSQWLKYCCCENAFNSLKDFLDGNIIGNQFDREKQIQSYKEILANSNGNCGQKVHEFIKNPT